MNTTLIAVICIVFFSFIVPAVFYHFIAQKGLRFAGSGLFFPPLFGTLSAGCLILYFAFYNPADFLGFFTLSELLIVLFCVGGVYMSTLFSRTEHFFPLFLFIAALLSGFGLPDAAVEMVSPLPIIINRGLIVAAWFVFSYIYRYSNSGDAMTAIQSLTISCGVGVLGVINAIPEFFGFLGFSYAAACLALLSFTWPPARMRITDNEASCLGFMIFALMTWCAGENAGSCVIIFALYLLIDLLWAVFLRLTFIDKYSSISKNLAYFQALNLGFSPSSSAAFVLRGQLLLVFLGVFQAFTGEHGSLLLVSTFITMWFLYKFRNLADGNKKIRDINRQVLEDLQARVNEVKQYINKDNDF